MGSVGWQQQQQRQTASSGLKDNIGVGNVGVDNVTCMELRLTFSKPAAREDYAYRLSIIRSVYQQDDEA